MVHPTFEQGQYVYLRCRLTDPSETYEIVEEWADAPKRTRGWIVRSALGNEFAVLEEEISRMPVAEECVVRR